MYKSIMKGVVASLGLMAAQAHAGVISFDGLSGTLISNTYSESGYTFTMSAGFTPHYGDGGGAAGTLNWHSGGANATGVLVTLTQDGGNAFDLLSLDITNVSGTFAISAAGYTTQLFNAVTSAALNFYNVTSVTFDVGSNVGIDNLVVNDATSTDVPVPATIALFGFALAGFAFSRKKA